MKHIIGSDGIIKTHKLPKDSASVFQFNHNEAWVSRLLAELNEDLEPHEIHNIFELELKIWKRFKTQFQEYLVADFKLNLEFTTRCVNSLMPMQDSLSLEINAVYLESHLQNSDELSDSSDLFIDGELRELYFYEKKQISVYEIIHEHIFLNKNPYPSLSQRFDPESNTPQ